MISGLSNAAPAHPTGHGQVAPAISISNLDKEFARQKRWKELVRHPFQREMIPALQSVSFDVAPGEFFGLLGPNGAGKTTLFKILSTLILPDSGSVRVFGHDVVTAAATVRSLLTPVIASERSLGWRLSAEENLRLYAVLHRVPAAELRRRVAELLQIVGLADTGDKMVGLFSSGMRQRLLIARSLIARPQALLLDEPTRSLDPVGAREFRRFLRGDVAVRQGCTVLLATHNTEEALELCDRVAVLDHGAIRAIGTTQQIARQLGDDVYRVWTRDPAHRSFQRLELDGVLQKVSPTPHLEDGWNAVDVTLGGSADDAAHVLAFLIDSGVSVSRFERRELSLADLIERVVTAPHTPPPDA